MNAVSLFTGIAGLDLAIAPISTCRLYVENHPFCQEVLRKRMQTGDLQKAPIHGDIRTLDRAAIRKYIGKRRVDICTAGFPCQDISTAGAGRGLAGERSGLFFEVIRLVTREFPNKPTWLFLENVANIRKNGLSDVLRALSDAGYDARWCTISAASLGAHHTRRRWFCLAQLRQEADVADTSRDAGGEQLQQSVPKPDNGRTIAQVRRMGCWHPSECAKWSNEPDVRRVVDGISKELDQYLRRNSALGNAVVPHQAKYAFSILSGLLPYKGPSVKTVEAKQKNTRLQRGKKRTAPTVQSVVPVKKPFLTSNDAPGTRRSGRIRAMAEAAST